MTHETLRRSEEAPSAALGADATRHGDAPSLDWARLAARAGLAPGEPALLALSGGADSVALAHLAHRAQPLVAVHVDHGLRGDASDADAAFCRELCARLDVPFECVRVDLDPDSPDLERRAREARYGALAEVAQAHGLRTVLVAHHADDADETLLLRLLRGTHPSGIAGPGLRSTYPIRVERSPAGAPLEVVRPLLEVRGAALRDWLTASGRTWREDDTNRSPRFTRNRVRNALLPLLERTCGPDVRANLGALAAAIARVEAELEHRTPTLRWSADVTLGSPRVVRTPAAALRTLAPPLRRRALRAALLLRTGAAPADAHLDELDAALARAGRETVNLRRGFTLRLGPRELALIAPPGAAPAPEPRPLRLDAPVPLGGGYTIVARCVHPGADAPPPRTREAVELTLGGDLEARLSRGELVVRAPRPGDRLHPLGAAGSRPLRRFLADAGVPREDRARVPLVALGDEILWVCGLRPAEPWRVRLGEARRLRLELAGDLTHR